LGNRVYLYEGINLDATQLADVFTQNSSTSAPDDAIAPFAVATLVRNSLTGSWEYAFGFIPPEDYTLAFACDTAGDDSVDYDGLTVPLPTDQTYEITLLEGEEAVCDLAEDGSC